MTTIIATAIPAGTIAITITITITMTGNETAIGKTLCRIFQSRNFRVHRESSGCFASRPENPRAFTSFNIGLMRLGRNEIFAVVTTPKTVYGSLSRPSLRAMPQSGNLPSVWLIRLSKRLRNV